MPAELSLPVPLKRALWKVKIRDNETREPPHVSILRRTKTWRINLRTGLFMDARPDPAEVPQRLLVFIREETNWNWLCDRWDEMYPNNPVASREDEDDADQHSSPDAT